MMTRALVLDPERKSRRTLQVTLEGLAIESVAAASAAEAVELFVKQRFDLVLLDLALPGADVLELLPKLRELHADVPIIVLSAYGTMQAAVNAIERGAFDFALKPCTTASLEVLIRRALEVRKTCAESPVREPSFQVSDFAPAPPPSANGATATALAPGDGYALEPAVADVERRTILRALGAARDNKARAARLLRVSERTLWYKLKRYGL